MSSAMWTVIEEYIEASVKRLENDPFNESSEHGDCRRQIAPLCSVLFHRFQSFGSVKDLDAAISYESRLMDDKLSRLGELYQAHWELTDDEKDFVASVEWFGRVLELAPWIWTEFFKWYCESAQRSGWLNA